MRQRQSLSFSSSSSAFLTSAHGTGLQTAHGVHRESERDAGEGSHDAPVKKARSERPKQQAAAAAPSASASRAPAQGAALPPSDLDDLSGAGLLAIRPPQPTIRLQPFAGISAVARSVEQRVHLPETFEGFLIYCAGLILVVLGMTLHISLSAEILQAEVRVHQLKFEYERIGQQNSELIWQIARESSLERLQHRVAGLGYAPITKREYVPVVVQSAPTAAVDNAAAKQESAPTLNLMEQLRAYFGGGAGDSALPNGGRLGAPASVRYVGPENEDNSSTGAPAEWWSKVWGETLERGEKSLEWITGGE